jgi:hypothetical protein
VPFLGVKKRVLLPYEIQLIELLGCSREEYEFFVEESQRKAGARPAEYDCIPEIVAGPLVVPASAAAVAAGTAGTLTALGSILVSVAIGIAVSAISFLLMPKPRGAGQTRTLGSTTGQDRFAQTSGFDSLAELAQYGESVPIIWTKYVSGGDDGVSTGGVLVTPKLVWSRMFSLVSQQAYKLLYVIGETGISPPDLAGVYTGNAGLDALEPSSYALWWSENGRPSRTNLLYGSQSGPATGDPQQSGDLFATNAGPTAFCQALTPSNNTAFGVSNPIPNGTQYKLNYTIVSKVKKAPRSDVIDRNRAKVCGFRDRGDGTADYRNGGKGYGYFRRQGIVGGGGGVGSTVTYVISGNKLLARGFFGGANDGAGGGELEDVNNTLDSECAASDDALQLGETVIINHSLWRVVDRSLPIWTIGETQRITLRCIEVLNDSAVRSIGENNITTNDGNVNEHEDVPLGTNKAGSVYDNLARFNAATVKNTRACEITQIGIRSLVWGRFGGLCNFNSLLSADQIQKLDGDGFSVQSGTMSQYFTRTSGFTIYYRPIGASNWSKTGINFCVRGSSPVNQFHQIAIQHGSRSVLEFRLVPLTGAYINRLGLGAILYVLTGGAAATSLSGGGITISAPVQPITVRDCAELEQLIHTPSDGSEVRNFDGAVGIAEVSAYGGLITRSCDSNPEHQVVYVNEITATEVAPTFDSLATVGLSLRSSRSVKSLDQLRVWVATGVNASNSFPELIQYLLQRVNGLSGQLIDADSFSRAAGFCASRGLFFDGAITDKTNIREYITSIAPFFLLNFVIANGKLSLMPAISSTGITNIFTAGNIVEGSFSVEYLGLDQRRDFEAVMVYRRNPNKNQLPESRTVRVRYADKPANLAQETFDMSAFCTSREHAVQAARYFLSIRRRVTHAVKFKTVPTASSGIAPGNYIKVAVQQNVISSTGNGVISSTGAVTSVQPLASGSYPIVYYRPGDPDLATGTLVIANGVTADTQLFGALFSTKASSISTLTYLIEQVEIDDEGLINVTATEFPPEIESEVNGAGMITVPG